MSSSSLPLYAVIELLIRVAEFNPAIGEYKDHTHRREGYIIKTTKGTILFSNNLIRQQFMHPELITRETLTELALAFKYPDYR